MNILLPTTITESMIGPATNIPALDAGEVAWAASGSYAVADRRVYEGKVYACVKAHTATTVPPPIDPTNWVYEKPTNRMSPFDDYIYTKAVKAGLVKYVLTPGFFTGFALYGAEADEVDVTLRDSAGGVILVQETKEMWEQAHGEWEYLFGNLRRETKLTRSGLPIRPAAELEISLRRNVPTVDAALGWMAVGQWRTLLAPFGNASGTEYGVEVTPKSYSYYKQNDDGTYTRRQGRQAKVITASVVIDAREAPAAEDLLRRILDIPVAVEASNLPRYGHVSTVGFVTGSVVADTWATARVNIKVEGNV